MKKIILAGCAIVENNAILLLNRKKTGWYELPGGKIDSGESAEEAAKREIKEELGCDVEIVRRLGEKDFEENGYVMGYTWFLARTKGQPEIQEPDKFDHLKYVPLNELRKHTLSANMRNLADKLEKGLLDNKDL